MEFLVISIFILGLLYYKTKNLKRSCTFSLFSLIVGIIGNRIGDIVFYKILGLKSEFIGQFFIFAMLFIVISIVSITVARIRIEAGPKSNISNINEEYFLMATISSLLAFIYISLTLYIKHESINEFIEAIIVTLAFISIIILSLIFYRQGLKESLEKELLKRELENLKAYSEEIENVTKEMRAFKHDYKNILLSLNEYIENNKWDNLKVYFKQEVFNYTDDIDKDNLRFSLLSNIKILPLKSLISSKIIKAKGLNIEVFIDIQEVIEDVDMSVVDLCRVIGNLLDNAIEEAEKSSEKSIQLGIVKKGQRVLFIIKNSTSKDVVDVHKMFQKGFSTKGKNRGFGLNNVKDLIDNKYVNVTLSTEIDDNREWVKQLLSVKRG